MISIWNPMSIPSRAFLYFIYRAAYKIQRAKVRATRSRSGWGWLAAWGWGWLRSRPEYTYQRNFEES